MFNKLIVEYTYDPKDVPTFTTQKESDDWHKALGRLVAYAMKRDTAEDLGHDILNNPQDRINLLLLNQMGPGEILSIHHRAHKVYEPNPIREGYYTLGKVSHRVEDAIEALRSERPFVMGAITHSDGVIGFHS